MAKRKFLQDTKAKFIVRESHLNARREQLLAAVAFCRENSCKGKKAISSGICPLIKDHRTINKELEKNNQGSKRKYSGRKDSILTPGEEHVLVSHMKNLNRAGQGIKRPVVTKLVHDMLVIRSKVNAKNKGGRKYCQLSRAARNFLFTKKLSKSFWRKLEVRHDIPRKRQGTAASQVQLTFSGFS